MRTRSKQSGLTLPEMAVVIATIALLVGFALPAIRSLVNSFETQSGAKTMISAALASGRAIAAREQRYAGVRFQQDSAGNQYMIFIMHEEPGKMGNLTIGFKAVEGVKPIKLPETAIVTDLRYNPDLLSPAGDSFIDSDVEIANANVFRDSTSFSVIFSPSGRLVLHD
jgi:type II secretory pathway pseudopilin PulG